MIEDSGLRVIVSESSVSDRLPSSDAHVVVLDRDAETIDAHESTKPSVEVSADNLAYVIYTSGSTGKPKGVLVTHRNVGNFFVGMDERIQNESSGDGAPGTWLAVTSLSFDISVLELFWTLARGFKIVLFANDAADESSVATEAPDFSLFYFASDASQDGDKYRLLLDGARFGDENGFCAVWTPERHFHAFGGIYPNPSVISAAIAATTKNIGIRAGSCVLPLHHPVRVAEEWSVVDNLSGGRVGISFAAGW
jgi:acyl-CoA synthetase (AMP-forming)/AMP-acid ligase II